MLTDYTRDNYLYNALHIMNYEILILTRKVTLYQSHSGLAIGVSNTCYSNNTIASNTKGYMQCKFHK